MQITCISDITILQLYITLRLTKYLRNRYQCSYKAFSKLFSILGAIAGPLFAA
jgi:hypothetical protein